ncbi:MAG: beta-propeller domain-containing protein [Nanoarchaeota archaeon]
MVNLKVTIKMLSIVLLIVMLLNGCSLNTKSDKNETQQNIQGDSNLDRNALSAEKFSDELKKFSSKEEFEEYFIKNMQKTTINMYSSGSGGIGRTDNIEFSDNIASDSVSEGMSSSKSSENTAQDFSQTNNQVEKVDEADIVKNDGKYIYTISDNNLIILDAYPAENSKILSKLEFKNKPQEFFIYDDKLVVFNQEDKRVEKVDENNFIPQETSESFTNIFIYDIKNKEEPTLLENYSVVGNYYDSRMIDGFVYTISNNYFNYYYGDIGFPEVYNGNTKILTPDIYYFDNYFDSYSFNTISSIDLNKEDLDINAKTFMLGDSNTLYVSEDNIYIAYKKYYSYDKLDIFKSAVLPILPQDVQSELNSILKNANYQSDINWNDVTSVLEDFYNNIQEDEKEEIIEEIEKSVTEYSEKLLIERQKTLIHKININKGDIEYDTKGEVKGHLLNQFSLDESSDNHLRVATTTSYWSRNDGRQQFNNVYVLDDNMELVGKIEELAQDERIYSTRFMQDKLYMVTFKEIDPLFVIDLKDNENPKVLGELKIPGYSTYLHPYNEDFLIGIGYDTKESEWGGVVNNGVKLSLFDVSDFSNPKEVDTYIVKGKYTDSIALYEHKAFLFDKDKNLLVIPVREHIEYDKEDSNRYYYNYDISAFVFNIDESGFELNGKVTHQEDKEYYSYWEKSSSSIQRTLFMDNVLYTISEEKVLSNDLTSLDLIKEIGLGYKEKPRDEDDIVLY